MDIYFRLYLLQAVRQAI